MSLEQKRFLVENDLSTQEIKEGTSKLVSKLKELITEVEVLQKQKNDTSNLKNSYKEYVDQNNATIGVLHARLESVEKLLKKLVQQFNQLENLE